MCAVPLPTELLVPLGVTEVFAFVPLGVTEVFAFVPLGVTEVFAFVPLGVTEVDDVIPHGSPPVLPAVVFPAVCQGAVVRRTPAIAIS